MLAGLTTFDVTERKCRCPETFSSCTVIKWDPWYFLQSSSRAKLIGTRDTFWLFMLLKMYFAMTVYLQNTRKEPSCLA